MRGHQPSWLDGQSVPSAAKRGAMHFAAQTQPVYPDFRVDFESVATMASSIEAFAREWRDR